MTQLLRVLIVEDAEADVRLLLDELRRSGYEPMSEWVNNAVALKAALIETVWDILITDFSLWPFCVPVVTALRKNRGLDVPIVVVSAVGAEEITTDQAGLSEHVSSKNLDQLAPAIGRLLCEAGMRLARRQAQAAIEAANARVTSSNAALEQRSREIALLGEMSSQVQTCLTVEEAYTIVADFAQLLFPENAGALYVLAASQNLAEAVAVWGEPPAALGDAVFDTDGCWALRRGRAHFVENTKDGVLCQHVALAGPLPASYLCVPLIEQNNALGILHLQGRRLPSQESAESEMSGGEPGEIVARIAEFKQHLAQIVAEHLALALSNIRLRERLREQSIRDPLTGLFNRRYMEETLERELHRAIRNEYPLSILMLALDHFGHFNDTFGREAGGTYLRALANFLQSHIGPEDIACRYRDDQFALILPETSLEIARHRAEQLQMDIKGLKVEYGGQLLENVTMSLGLSSFPEHGATADEILQMAYDHIVKPLQMTSRLSVGALTLDPHTFEVFVGDRNAVLTPVEFELLYFLMRHAGQVFTSEQLLQEVWNYPPRTGSPELVRVHIRNIRSKIEREPKRPFYVKTIGRFGYTVRTDAQT